ncbi:MAG: creatininase family protein [Chloroflexota bacterium]
MRLQDLNWMDVERYLEHDKRIILVTGSTEQHAYLSLMTDILIPMRIAEAVAQRTNVLIAPPLNFGVSFVYRDFPGTITLSKRTFDHVVLEIVESLFTQGFRAFMIINGHGGNSLPDVLQSFQQRGAVSVNWYDWWRSEAATTYANQLGLKIQHANWGENFPFNRVAESPVEEKPPVDLGQLQQYYDARRVLGDGSFGGPYQVDDAIMMGLFEVVVEEAVGMLQLMTQS